MEKQEILKRQDEILELIEQFCTKKLDPDYFRVCEHVVKKMGRKRSVPFVSGQLEVWAASILHAVGTVNFLFDKSNIPYASIDDINDFFGTKKSTTSGKSKIIRDLLKMRIWDNEFAVQSMKESNPYKDMVSVNGMILPISALPLHIQDAVRAAKESGKDFTISF